MSVVRIPGRPGPPREQPIGMLAAAVGKALDRAFDDALVSAGGNRPTWLILLAVKAGAGSTQSALAELVGISGPTLTHHLDRLDAAGLVARNRDPANRRTQPVTLTTSGEAMFLRLRTAAVAFDKRLRIGIADADIARLRELLTALRANVPNPATAR
ncbi:MAG: MarR family winged helix-turn-helix transcriptional regulator [Jatrophihabitantaceae bacterium]